MSLLSIVILNVFEELIVEFPLDKFWIVKFCWDLHRQLAADEVVEEEESLED